MSGLDLAIREKVRETVGSVAVSGRGLSRAALGVSILLLAALAAAPRAAGRGEPGPVFAVRVDLVDRQGDLVRLQRMDLDIDGVFEDWARIYLVREEIDKLERLGFPVTLLWEEPAPRPPAETPLDPRPSEGAAGPVPRSIPVTYHTYETLTAELQSIALDRPDLTRLVSLGPTVQGRQLWMMRISDDPDVEVDEPEVAFLAAMHGDEVVGKELCIGFIHYLLDNYGTDARVRDLVDGTEIWIMPSVNPDGTALGQRYNAGGMDLNRDYPDWWEDPINTPDGRQPETQALMAWTEARSIDLSANFHGGALLVNYPWDTNASHSNTFTPTPEPDHSTFLSISLTYAENNTPMYTNGTFPDGVTNGAAWYAIKGGLQDWSYAWNGNFDVTLEVSNAKWPSGFELPGFWDDNLESMLAFLERVHEGLRGVVTDASTGAPVAAAIRLDTDPFAVYTDPDVGDYHRLVLPGSYDMHLSAPGYAQQTIAVQVTAGPAARYDVALQPLPVELHPVSIRVVDGLIGDHVLDPGDTETFAVTLTNLGRPATSVAGRLISTGWHLDVLRDEATFADIGSLSSVESNVPYFRVHLDPAVPPGRKIGIGVQWDSDQGAGSSEPLFFNVGAPVLDAAAAADLPQSILDFVPITSEVELTDPLELGELRVSVDLSHSYIGDLRLRLTSPAGTSVILHDRSGGSTNDIVGTYGVELSSAESLSAFDGEHAAGTWTLEVHDLASGDTGTLNAFSVEVSGWPIETSLPEMKLRDIVRVPGAVHLSWWSYPGVAGYRVYRATAPDSPAGFIDVTAEDGDPTDSEFVDAAPDPLSFYLVTGVGAGGEGPWGHFEQ